jgi:hypothetical protein
MRWFIGTLIAVNLAILLWGWLGTDDTSNGKLAAPDVGSIRLMSEVNSTQPQEAEAVPIPSPPRSSGVMTEPATPPASPAAVAKTEAEASAPAPQQPQAPAGSQATPTVAGAPSEPPSKKPEPAISAPEPEMVPEPDIKPAAPPSLYCNRIGPFENAAAAKSTLAYLQKRGKVSTQSETRQARIGYWVLIPRQANRAAAEAMVAKLKAKGITDYWIVSKGMLKNAISLGVFSQQNNADSFARNARAKGFKVVIRDKTKAHKVLWLAYQGKSFIPPAQVRQRAPAGITIKEQDCP